MEILLLFGIWALFAIFSAILAEGKKRSLIGWGVVGLFFGPFGLLVAALPPLAEPAKQNAQPGQTRSCPDCREPIRFDARVCKHCGLRYPYMAEPARTHVVAIADLHREGRTIPEIIASLDGRNVRPALGTTWTAEMISAILRDHVA